MNNEPTPQSPEERELQEVFDETAAHPSEAQLARMVARAEQIPGGGQRRRKGWRSTVLIPLAAAAAVALAVGGAWWAQDRKEDVPVASTAPTEVPTEVPTPSPTATPTAAPTAVASVDRDENATPDDTYDDLSVLPADPLAVLDGDFDNGGGWMGDLDLLHGPIGDDDAFWEEMELLMEEGG